MMAFPRYAIELGVLEEETIPVRLSLGRRLEQQGLNEMIITAVTDNKFFPSSLVPFLLQEVAAGRTLLILELPASGDILSDVIRWIREDLVKGTGHNNRLAVIAKFGQNIDELRSLGFPAVVRSYGEGETSSLRLMLHILIGATRTRSGRSLVKEAFTAG